MVTKNIVESIYTDGSYLDKTGGTWHLEDSPFKARQIVKILSRHPEVRPTSICEIGCGAGGILSQLQTLLPKNVTYTGYEISPQAHAISAQFENSQCRYILGDAFSDATTYDLVLVMDVVEHVEDCFSFLRKTKHKGRLKLYHIPVDAHVSAILRGTHAFDTVGHIHMFTIETALKSIEYSGLHVIDWLITDIGLNQASENLGTRFANVARLLIGKLSARLAARLLGGYSLMVLAE